ncbi:ribonuclease Z [Nafulsella turpanensis]|uniref:ribonuclease Z n=1 Tax=Nafulsella turpanensis TaxID=1265690 RepID=UPI00034C57BD|nr:ribonuclease Z [Nafulsella turpanensis]
MSFQIKILGSNSATPAHNRNQSSQLLNIGSEYFLIDCGEGTQMQLIRYRTRFHKISHIFISHLHGDHYLGLMGLLLTMHLQKRSHDLYIFGPQGLDEIITVQLKHSRTVLSYKLHFTALQADSHTLIYESNQLSVYTLPLVHRIPCTGFLFKEKPKDRRMNKAKLLPEMTGEEITRLKKGEDIYSTEGQLRYRCLDYTLPPRRSRSFAYCSDTKYEPALIPYIKNVDLLYHEATFAQDQAERAAETFHSTAEQAAHMAREANAATLVLGHYSVRYKDLSPLLSEAQGIFPNTRLAIEGETIEVKD